ncbi:hypothetical protein T4A_10008 [Trichinella pseudospiralis]|uniref:Uncharacterized protein n=1 Tax=Trichinella pseudospiralis TaxID=6337 RepID=A0A0V1B263_TRIPS|nr:hypothetical protein T4A_10008 [Trichinella pseudospiralis]
MIGFMERPVSTGPCDRGALARQEIFLDIPLKVSCPFVLSSSSLLLCR